jgi:hypothetical protein
MHDYQTSGRVKKKLSYALFFVMLFLLLSGAAMFLWNALLPQIVHVPVINYWQSLGLIVLCRILFGRFRFWRGRSREPGEGPRFLKDKLMSMDESDRAAFKEEWRKRCGRRDSDKA